MMSRKVKLGRSTWTGGHRRSPRISGSDSWKNEADSGSRHKLENPAKLSRSTTERNSRIKRKRHQLQAVSSSITEASQVVENDSEPVNCCDNEESVLPEKKVLEHILDILQRRDTHEIFAEPVDPDEVVDYYEIIKEPMDFGTMRAKLHEGMYQNLEQFKHDVFLITENAMHFNSASTIYFRQGRAIHELSKRIFHVLETDPKKFESEFLVSRRRSTRRPHIEAKVCRFSAEIKPTSPPKETPNSVAASNSVLERKSRETPKPAIIPFHGNTRRNNCNFLLGAKDIGRWSDNIETDRRYSYLPPKKSFFHNNNSIFHSKYLTPEPTLTNTPDFSYRESLVLFVKELGPTAQMIATRRIQGLQEKYPIYSTTDSFFSGREKTTPGDHKEQKEAHDRKGRGSSCHGVQVSSGKNETPDHDHQNQMVEISGRLEENVRPVILALEHSRANSLDPKSRNKKPSTCPPPSSRKRSSNQININQAMAMPPPATVQSPPEPPIITTSPPVAAAMVSSPGFTFDMNFLKAKLKQMEVVSRDKQVMAVPANKNGFLDGAISVDNSNLDLQL